jgi:hypothetical protein
MIRTFRNGKKVEYVKQIKHFLILDDLPYGEFKGEDLYKSICFVCHRTRFRTVIYMIYKKCYSKKCKDLFDYKF